MSHHECPVDAARVVYENEILDRVASEIAAKSNSTKPLCSDRASEIQSARATHD